MLKKTVVAEQDCDLTSQLQRNSYLGHKKSLHYNYHKPKCATNRPKNNTSTFNPRKTNPIPCVDMTCNTKIYFDESRSENTSS